MSGIRAGGSEHRLMRGKNGKAFAFGAADWLHLAAAPTFASMALLTGLLGGAPADMMCSAAHGMSPLSGMVMMYMLMAAFHSGPWLKLISGRRHKAPGGLTTDGNTQPSSLTSFW